MGRPHRRESESGIHHVMNRGVDRQAIFRDDADRRAMGERLAEIHERFGVSTLAYCLMGNHLHLVLRTPDGVLPTAMHHLTSTYSHEFNARHGRDGPLVRGRYLSIPVETDSYLLTAVRYVHRNPLDIAGVRTPCDYRWSSYRAYLGLRPSPAFLDREPVLELVGGDVAELARTTETPVPAPIARRADLAALVSCARAVGDLAEPHVDRTLLLLIGERAEDPGLVGLIDDMLGPRSGEAARKAVARARARLDDPAIVRAVTWMERQLATT